MVVAIIVGFLVKEYPFPDVEFGITQPAFAEMWGYLPFMVGFPGLDIFMLAIPTALIAYIIAFGDIIVGGRRCWTGRTTCARTRRSRRTSTGCTW